jgi:hypothetical protein
MEFNQESPEAPAPPHPPFLGDVHAELPVPLAP